jgi:hypothetical protein
VAGSARENQPGPALAAAQIAMGVTMSFMLLIMI